MSYSIISPVFWFTTFFVVLFQFLKFIIPYQNSSFSSALHYLLVNVAFASTSNIIIFTMRDIEIKSGLSCFIIKWIAVCCKKHHHCEILK